MGEDRTSPFCVYIKSMSIFDSLTKAIKEFEVALQETSIPRWKDTMYKEYGFIVISAERHESDEAENARKTKELENEIKRSGFQYYPVDGHYLEKYEDEDGEEHEVQVEEDSFIVVNVKRNGKEVVKGDYYNLQELRDLGIEWCGMFNQDSVLFVNPRGMGVFLNRDGKIVFTAGSYRGDNFRPISNIKDRSNINYVSFRKHKDDGYAIADKKAYMDDVLRMDADSKKQYRLRTDPNRDTKFTF